MLMFIVYVLILYIASIGCGSYIKKESKLFPLRSVIGFCTYLGITQLVYYPMQYFKASSTVVNVATFLMLSFAFVYGLFKLKKEDFKFIKSYEFWIILVVVFIVIKIVPGFDAGDDIFYMSLFKDNSSLSSINSINPRTGIVEGVQNYYLFQGFYLLMSFLYMIQNTLFSGDINNIFISYRTTISLLMVIFSSSIFIYIKNEYKDKKNFKVFYLIQLLSFFLVAVLEWAHIYWGSFMLFQIFVPLAMILFDLYLKDKEKYKYILMIVNLGTLTLASSMLFLFGILAFSYFCYEVFITKKVKSKDYFVMLIPSLVYALFLFNKFIYTPILLILIFIFYKFNKQIDELVIKYFKYVVILMLILFIGIGYMREHKFTTEIYRITKVTILYNIAILLYGIYLLRKRVKINPNIFVFMIVVLIFFNPITQPFVTHYLTSRSVYYRLFYITRNPFIVTIVFLSIYDTCKKHKFGKYLKPLFICGICLLLANYGKNFLSSTVMLDNYNIKYDYILREDNYSKELGKVVATLPDNSKIYSIYFAPRMYNDNLITDVVRYPEKKSSQKRIIVKMLYTDEEITDEMYTKYIETIKERHYDYLITYNHDNRRVVYSNDLFDIIYENDMFVLIKTREELWES